MSSEEKSDGEYSISKSAKVYEEAINEVKKSNRLKMALIGTLTVLGIMIALIYFDTSVVFRTGQKLFCQP